jgi:hypothetical protein
MKKTIFTFAIALVFILSIFFSSCVSQPRYSDYVGLSKEDAFYELEQHKTDNIVKLILNWLLWGWTGLYIPSIVDTINLVSYTDDYNSIERKIDKTENGAKVGQ